MYFAFFCREKFDGTGTQGQWACNSTSKKFQQYRQRRRIGKRAIGENIFYCIMSPFSGCYFVSCRSLQSSFRSKKKKSLQSSFVGISPSVHLQFLLHRVNRQLKWLQNEPPKRNTVATLPTNILQSETKAAVWNQWSKCRRGSHRPPPSTLRPVAQKSRRPRVQNQNHHQLKRPQGGPQWRWVFRTSEQAWAPRSSSVWARPRVSERTRPLRNRSMRSSGNWNGIRAARMRITSTTTMGYPDDDGGGNTKERGLWDIKMA